MIITLSALLPILIFQIVSIFRQKNEKITSTFIIALGLYLLIELVIRSIKINFPALTNTFEVLILFSGLILLITGIYSLKLKENSPLTFGATFISFIFLLICNSPLLSDQLQPPIQALQSNWLIIHVALSFIGEAFFVVSFISAILQLTSKQNSDYYYKITINSIIIGYPIYTAGALIFGSIWASSAWGAYWSWDPKETWALITFLIYTIIIHTRKSKLYNNNFTAWASIIGFSSSMFTFFGVNYLLDSLHSYTG